MAKHCSWRAGGSADLFYEPVDQQDLLRFLEVLHPETPVTWLGLGSNLLVRDGGIRGVVISVLNRLKRLRLVESGLIFAECGVTCAKLARFCHQHDLGGADFLAGIPGTVGGALAMNAGAFGYETWQFVEAVDMLTRQGKLVHRKKDEFEIGYRSVRWSDDEWFGAGYLRFPQRQSDDASNIRSLLERRNSTQPIGQPSCGSVFMNPQGDHAARLIEASGLKGYAIGGACVSEKHANFIINTGGASAADIENLIHEVQRQVQKKQGVTLRTEVRIIGDQA